jgi:hypothetical protein
MILDDLKNEKNYPKAADKRKRGYEFETYLFDTFDSQKIKTKRPFKSFGEQIDGGIYFDGIWYLIEAKWHSKELPVSEVYSFKGKVDGKLSGTRGFFISWSGYSKECADALSLGKDMNVILCDSKDVELAAEIGWKDVLREKLMFASLYGELYASEALQKSLKKQENNCFDLEIFVEHEIDAEIISLILNAKVVNENISFVPCSGKMSAINLASRIPKRAGAKRILILDSDGNPNQENELSILPLVDETIAIEPELEALFYPDSDDPKHDFRVNARNLGQSSIAHATSLIDDLFKNDPQRFVSRLLNIVGNK